MLSGPVYISPSHSLYQWQDWGQLFHMAGCLETAMCVFDFFFFSAKEFPHYCGFSVQRMDSNKKKNKTHQFYSSKGKTKSIFVACSTLGTANAHTYAVVDLKAFVVLF